MIIWRILVKSASSESIDKEPDRAFAWIRRHLPELFLYPADEAGKRYQKDGLDVADPLFDWEGYWPRWRLFFQALLWLEKQQQEPSPSTTPKFLIPSWVQQVLNETIGKTRPMILAEDFAHARIVLFCSVSNAGKRYVDSLDEFWREVFVSFFDPMLLPDRIGYCIECRKPLRPTIKLKRISTARLCSSCRVTKSRRLHPEEAREAWREQKKKQREEEKETKPAGTPLGTRRPTG
jgi:hypothetical protein